jgi:hypothetical protein
MTRHIPAAKALSALALFSILVFAVSSAMAQAPATTPATTPAATPTETSPAIATPAVQGPISHNFKLKGIGGNLNILVNPDGSWDFSGSGKAFPHKDYDVTIGLKNTTGAIILFQYIGDATNGIQFSKTGKNPILKDNFASFASKHWASWSYRFSEDKEGRRLAYEARMRKLEELRKAEEEAKKKHQEAEAAAAAKRRQQEEQQQAAAEQAKQSSGGGGGSSVGSVMSTIGTVAGIAGTILSFL